MTTEHATDCPIDFDELSRLREELETERRAFETSRGVWQHEREHQEKQIFQRATALKLRERELKHQRELLERESSEQRTANIAQEMTAENSPDYEPAPSSETPPTHPMALVSETSGSETSGEPADGSAYDPIAELERLRNMVDTEEGSQDESPQAITPIRQADANATPAIQVTNAVGATNAVENESDEDSIDEYMSKLMSRVNGKSDRLGSEPVVPIASMSGSVSSQEVQSPIESGQPGSAASGEPQEPAPPKQRSAPPDLTTHLAAMREVANTSARTAINRSVRRKRDRTVFISTGASTAVFVTTGYVLFGFVGLLKIAAVFAICAGVAALVRKYRNTVPISRVADWANRQRLRWQKPTSQDDAADPADDSR